jgi:4-amino-4-deoxy-L-arabinose transferase-like glycosyltransferase
MLSDEARISDRQKRNLESWGTLALILAVGLGIRYIFYTGMVRGDSLNYAHAAFLRSQGITDLGSWAGLSRIGMYGPVALLYSLFGPSEMTTHAYPLLASMVTTIFLFKIGELLGNRRIGLIAALLWAFLPLDIHLSTSLLPDVIVTAFMTGALYFFLRGSVDQKLLNSNIFLGLGFILAGILVKPIAIMGLISAIILLLFTRRQNLAKGMNNLLSVLNNRTQKILFALIILGGSLGIRWYASIQPYPFLVTLAKTSSDMSAFFVKGLTELEISSLRLDFSSLLLFFTPLYIISLLWALRSENNLLWRLLVWTFTLFLYYEWGTINTDPFFYVALQPFNEARNFLFLMAPLTIIAAAYVERFMPKKHAELVIIGAALFGFGSAWFIRSVHWNSIPIWLWGATLAVPILAIGSVIFEEQIGELPKWAFGSSLLLMLCLALLRPVAPYHSSWYWDRIDRVENLREAAKDFAKNAEIPIHINGRGNAMTLNFASNFELGFDWLDEGLGSATENRIITDLPQVGHYQVAFDDNKNDGENQLFESYKGSFGGSLTVWLVEVE